MLPFKPICWLGDSRERVRRFSPKARARAGFELWEVQLGNAPTDWRSMATVGPGVKEIRIHAEVEYRILYVAQFPDAIHVLHAFSKKTFRAVRRDVELARVRFRALVESKRIQNR